MQEFIIPIVYYPLKLLFVDDNPVILASLAHEFKNYYNVQTAQSAQEAIDIINNQPSINYELFNDVTETDLSIDQSEAQITKLSLNISDVLKLANDKDKYEDIGVVITDYNMPEINGIELCSHIESSPIRKILITANMDISKAVNALNAQLIDCYIPKEENNVINDLKNYINLVHLRYFNHLTALISKSLAKKRLTFLKDKEFSELFNKTISEYNIQEYYLIDPHGSFLMIDKQQNKFVLVVYTDANLDTFYEYFRTENVITSLLNGVKMRELIPFFGINIDHATIDIAQWHRHFYNAKKHSIYYWNVIQIS